MGVESFFFNFKEDRWCKYRRLKNTLRAVRPIRKATLDWFIGLAALFDQALNPKLESENIRKIIFFSRMTYIQV